MYAKVKKTGEILYDAYIDEIDNGYYLALTARLTDMGLLNGGAMPEK